jgi:hypothetical protein
MREFVARVISAVLVFTLVAAAFLASAWIIGVAWRIFRAAAGLDA